LQNKNISTKKIKNIDISLMDVIKNNVRKN